MKKIACVMFLATAILCVGPFPAHAQGGHSHWGGHARGGGGHPSHWGFRFYWGGPLWGWPWGPYPYYSPPPVYVPQQPPVYVQPQPQAQEPQYYWYYCQNPQGYYPYVQSCPGGWMKVVPTPTPNPSP